MGFIFQTKEIEKAGLDMLSTNYIGEKDMEQKLQKNY